ncbi:hypothetical protein LZ198_18845 [Myxococcus sp. K15C18031901]|uniref:hypothetical protein n=1 Tax=Myxococcus dinghuensis TaxID=2906761 RepID=UPI0020A73ACA|nr:hypothetical protein [Myxococcus dinghuensis]MCP3100934.1 hypothetical protein [Myxococcus dinghuensis]
MFYLLKLGPVPLSQGSTQVYLRITETGEPAQPVFEQDDDAGLRSLLEGVDASDVRCEPSLAEAGGALGLGVEEPPTAVLSSRAAIATFLAWGQRGLAGLGSDKALLFVQAATEYWDARPWSHWDDSQPFEVAVSGPMTHTFEGCVFHTEDGRAGLALYFKPGALQMLMEMQARGQGEAAQALPAIAVSLDTSPSYAVKALAAAHRVPRLPMPLKTGREGVGVPTTLEALVLVATLRAVARLTPEQDEVHSSVVAGDERMEVRVRAPTPRVRH